MKLYYVDAQNKPAGPLTLDELKVLIKAGVLSADPLVIEEGGTEWKRLSSFPVSRMGAPLPPPPPPPPAAFQQSAPLSTGKIHPAVYMVAAIVVAVVLIVAIGKGKNGKTSDGQNVSSSQMAERNPPDEMPKLLPESAKRKMEASVLNKMVNDLRQIDAAMNQCALEKGKRNGDPITWDEIRPYINMAGLNFTPNNYILPGVGYNPQSVKYGDILR
jgi:hypothetical protein